jgi:hypothetical protein
LKRLNDYLTLYQSFYANDSAKLATVATCFPPDSRAAAWLSSHSDEFSTIQDFHDACVPIFGGTAADERRLKEKLLGFCQLDSDRVRDYYNRFCDLIADIDALASFLHGNASKYHFSACEQQAQFIHGLRPSLRGEVNRVYIRNPDLTVDDLLIEAELEESVKREARRIKPNLNAIPNVPRQRFDGGCFYC